MTTQAFTKNSSLGIRGPTTARQAFAVVQPVARQYDAEAKLRLIVSGEDINHLGASHSWEFFFDLPTQKARAIFQVESDPIVGAQEGSPSVLKERTVPVAQSELLTKAWESDLANPPLPVSFRDSAEAVQSLAGQGVDFIAGPTDMVLSAKVLPNGEAVWQIWQYDDEYLTPFT